MIRKTDTVQKFSDRDNKVDSTKKIYKHKENDYRYFTENQDSVTINIRLSLADFYNQNDYRKDLYGYMPLPNIGQGANELIFNPSYSVVPQMGFNAKHFDYKRIEDIRYFNVKSPMTEFAYQNGYREGQVLETTFAHNINRFWNYSISYKGLSSYGKYDNQKAKTSDVVATINYHSPNGRYRFWTHYASQNINNEENGGIIKDQIDDFEDNNSAYSNRESFTTNLQEASSKLTARRFHLTQEYGLLKGLKKDSTQYLPLKLRHVFTYEKQKFIYKENSENDYFDSDILSDKSRYDETEYGWMHNVISASGNLNDRLQLEAGLAYDHFRYGYDSILVDGLINVPKEIKGNLFSLMGKLQFKWNDRILLNAQAQYALGNEYGNNYLVHSDLNFRLNKDIALNGGINLSSAQPALNMILHQSFYSDYNYYNSNFENINTQHIFGSIQSDKYVNVKANFYNIQNFVCIDNTERPKQGSGSVNTFNITLQKTFNYQKWYFDNTITYQKVTNGEELLPLPSFVDRNTLYYQTGMFKNKAVVQLGASVYIFDKFQSRNLFPVLGEYTLQTLSSEDSAVEIGRYPLFDLFMNMRVKRMRIYIKAQHLNSIIGPHDYYSIPNNPYNDWSIRLGLKWFLFT